MVKYGYCIIKRTKRGKFVGAVSGLGRNKGTWDATHTKTEAEKLAKQLRVEDDRHTYTVEPAF